MWASGLNGLPLFDAERFQHPHHDPIALLHRLPIDQLREHLEVGEAAQMVAREGRGRILASRKRLAKRPSNMNSCQSWFRHKPHREEGKYFVPGRDGWLASLVDQVLGHDTVWIRHVARKEWRNIGVRRAVG